LPKRDHFGRNLIRNRTRAMREAAGGEGNHANS
jgi:hypothetical protein